ncbi:DoxX family membrane protein [Planomonospora sp. ID82291]|uniref:DoxX family membrane protein n=1 Tax=Planomonospora sp. ID82291 TaxID=2738136 RepID=UPI0018C41D08|nr:DoxX family membrane protein [Planomonospora sp. ID82291]MBG0816658.1 DoxX family membrane protein [Planomonospora sp. ID82291]
MASIHTHRDDTRSTSAHGPAAKVWAITRIALGWIFLWAFLDKLFGLGFSTPSERAWINGGSPTSGFLKGTGENALGGMFSGLAGQGWVDWLFMLGLLGIGTALILGIGLRVAAVTGALLMVLMWMAQLPLETNPIIDDHIIYALVLAGLALSNAGDTWGLGRQWGATNLVRGKPFLK